MRVVVIGAGMIGASIADALALRGAGVTVLEMRSPGRGASQASAGVLAPYTEAHGKRALLDLCARSFDRYDAFIAGVCARSQRRVEYNRCGTIEVALSQEEAAHLTSHGWIGDSAVRSEWLDPAALRSFEPAISPAAVGGLFIGAHGYVDVRAIVTALVASARASGAIFETPVEAVRVVPSRDHVEVRAGSRRYTADHVVVAAGSWSSRVRVAGAADPPVRPVRGQLLHLQWASGRPPSHIVWGRSCYTVPWADGSVLVGATVEDAGFDESTTVEGVQQLTSAVASLLPDARQAALGEVRVGLRPATPDELPIIGPLASAPNVTMATGHYRNGILLAPLTAALVSGYILDGTIDPMLAVTSPARFDRVAEGASS